MSYQGRDFWSAEQPAAREERSGEVQAQIGRLTGLTRALRADAAAVQAALALAERRFQATFVHAPVGIAHVGLDGGFLMVNPRFEEITGYDAQTLMRTGFQQITHPDDLNADVALLTRLHAGELQRYTMEKRYIRSDGSSIRVKLTVAMVRDERGEPEFYVAVVEDISEIRQAQRDALHDPLTGLLNRRGLIVHGERVLGRAAYEGEWLSTLYLDLDGFKALNDRMGHSAGDHCLVDIGRLLDSASRPQDVVARVGGDEFVLLLNGLSPDQAGAFAERLRRGLTELPAAGHGVSGSFGLLTMMPAAGERLEDYIRRADEAMLQAKRTGKNQVSIATSG